MGDGLGDHGLARARWAVEEHAAAGADPVLPGQLRVGEGVDHLQADIFLYVVQPGDVFEADGRFVFDDPVRDIRPGIVLLFALAGGARSTPLAAGLVHPVAVLGQIDQLRRQLFMLPLGLGRLGRPGQLQHALGRVDQIRLGRQVVALLIRSDPLTL